MDMAGHAGLDPADVDVFRALLARPETLAADLDPAAVDRLEALGLVRRGVDGALAALPPHRPLLAEAHRAQSRADALRETAETLRAEFHRRPGAARDAVEVVVGGPEIVGAGVQIARQARRLVRGFDRGPYFHDGSLPDDAQSRSWTRGVPWRVVYEGRSLQAEPPDRWEHLGSTPGETGRILPRLPFKLLIADDDAALVGLAGAAGQGEALVVRGSLLVDAFVRLFELQWELALPIADVARGGDDGADGLGGDVLTEVERRLVAMLSSGMTDEAMARAIGLSHRTVQRRLADLARRVGAEGRFQLGVQAARRGWV
ncbi:MULTISPECIES: helix-turn-helix transcriptional regulator [Micrococcus]|uniref:helix-turn-helix transcriptional regulator n=1 Tax=Micrococcus TaxID=1269 RepID=UPI000C9A476C|nr:MULTISPECIES: helix-turn-helix transcriptional regulator [Micrococcus]MBU8743504.1 LuxR family transcriptional regulator [Micrococcus luteus]MCK6109597.1 LuxR family transcriptional regulator [Micrococcus luteus]MCV7515984.1 LuxR family transcriptional regulator [Micrococcus luteus]MCV7699421.1 LuxR family transcriptional regulator [Micrococcus luteus]MCV7712277.1 LuxR family transcriptional regulator [Micrococcus luteus]